MVELYNNKTESSSLYLNKNKDGFVYLKNYINDLITDDVRALSMRHDVFELSFTPKGKELKYSSNGIWSREGRQTGKPARIIQKLLRKKYKSIDLETFNNLLKSEIMQGHTFMLVSGDDIQKYYNQNTYLKINGTLGNSCMRYNECSDYFDIYKDHAKMLICIKNNKISGRAVVWEIDDKMLMDRVYICDDYLEEQFILYAKDHKWWMRESNTLLNDGDCASWIGPDDEYQDPVQLKLYLSLKNKYFLFPYIDSFRYYDSETNELSTDPYFGNARCSDTEGGYQKCKKIVCASCGNSTIIWDDDEIDDDFYYSDLANDYYCSSCCEWNNFIGDYVPNDTETITVFDEFFEKTEVPLEYVNNRLILENNYHSNGCYFIKIEDVYYHRRCFKWSFDLNKYVLTRNEN